MRNQSIKSIGIAVLLVVAGCASTKTQQAPGEYVDDATVTTKVKAALVADSTTKARHIEVETFRGVVQLSGFVESDAGTLRSSSGCQESGRREVGARQPGNSFR